MRRKRKPELLPAGLAVLASLCVLGCGHSPGLGQRMDLDANTPDHGYDTNGDGQADYQLLRNPAGRIDRLVFLAADGRRVVDLDTAQAALPPHLVMILDGFGWEVLDAFYREGNLRAFYPPARVICPYPSMTDLAMNDLLATGRSAGIEAKYFDRRANKLIGGNAAYLAGDNMPYNRRLDYRAGLMTDVFGYVGPWTMYLSELRGGRATWEKSSNRETIAYFVTSAGVSTKWGRDGQIRALTELQRLCDDLLRVTEGRLALTLMSDHGHSYTPGQRIDIEGHLRSHGWSLGKAIESDRDVVAVEFGLVTFASFICGNPAALAADLSSLVGVELVSYRDGPDVIVRASDGSRACITHHDGRYGYEPTGGDPLSLAPILANMPADEAGLYDADKLLLATAEHHWPAPLQRLWRAHHDLVENPPDVLASLGDGWYFGSKSFAGAVSVASTHGSLNRVNSTAFVMSTLGPLPGPYRSREVSNVLGVLLRAEGWPLAAATQPTTQPK
jgi:hypothetical protein